VIVYRICKAKYANTAFSGAGGLDSSGRWHRKGQPIVYAACTLSLAAIELLIHLGRTDSKIAFVSVRATIPDDFTKDSVDVADLPANWNSSPPIDATMDLGTKWCASTRSVAISVPSAVIPGEFNYLLNPAHSDFKLIKTSAPEPFAFDQRLWK
jgi:RES domain-containing protein